jgi:DNA-binding LacI/PurR family transcriptional regulator
LIKPEELTLRSVTDDTNVQKERLDRALVQTKPSALIAMDIRPDAGTITSYTAAGVDAIFCMADDNCALGLMSVAKEKGVKIPDEIAIMGFDDLLIAQLSTPSLTTIKQPLEKIAETAYRMAVVHRNEILHKSQRIVFNPELVIRNSA